MVSMSAAGPQHSGDGLEYACTDCAHVLLQVCTMSLSAAAPSWTMVFWWWLGYACTDCTHVLPQVCTMSLNAAAPSWTMAFWWWAMAARWGRSTGWWRTAGAPPGVTRATSRCPATRTTSVALPPLPASLSSKGTVSEEVVHTPSIAFWHLAPNSTRIGLHHWRGTLYLYVAVHWCCWFPFKGLGTNKTGSCTASKHSCKHEARLPLVQKRVPS